MKIDDSIVQNFLFCLRYWCQSYTKKTSTNLNSTTKKDIISSCLASDCRLFCSRHVLQTERITAHVGEAFWSVGEVVLDLLAGVRKKSNILIVKLRSRPRSSLGPFLVHSKSILSHFNLFKFKSRRSGPGADAIFTVSPPPTHPPLNFSSANPDRKPIQTDLQPLHLDNTMEIGVLNIPAPVLPDSNSRLCGQGSS